MKNRGYDPGCSNCRRFAATGVMGTGAIGIDDEVGGAGRMSQPYELRAWFGGTK